MNKETVSLGDSTTLISSQMSMSVIKTGAEKERKFKVSINSEKINLKADFEFDFDSQPGQTWVMPFTDDKTCYFANMKKGAVPTTGEYTFKDKKYSCKDKDCLMMIDIGRGHHNYGIAYYWALTQGKLKDGRTFVLNLGDGFGNNYHSLEKASEDYIVIDGKHYKLDIT